MNFKKVMYMFFTLMSLTTIAGFLYTEDVISLFLAASINMISTFFKIGTTNTLSAELFASSLVADLHLIPAFFAFEIYLRPDIAVGLAIGALTANIFTTALILISTTRKDNENEY
jgi:hypothetical protein